MGFQAPAPIGFSVQKTPCGIEDGRSACQKRGTQSIDSFNIAALVAPLSWPVFLSTYWERRHLHLSRQQPDYYETLLTAADLEAVISRSDARYPAIRLARGGGYFAPEIYTRNVKHGDEIFAGVPDLQRISEEYRQGATVALPAIHRTWLPLTDLCEGLTAQLNHAAHANVYITPGNAKGFTPHYDVHEVFVLQIAGKKVWQLYEPVIPLPHRTQLFTPSLYTGQAPMAEVELNAGDLLYLPRGILHSTHTADRFSAHVTIGITVYTEADLVKEFLLAAIDDPELRKALPPGFATLPEVKAELRQTMSSAFDKLRAGADLDRLIDSFTDRVRATETRRPKPFRADQTVIDLESQLQAPPAADYHLTQQGGQTLLEFNGIRYHLPAPVASTLSAISKRESFRPAELIGPLNAEAVLALSRHLLDIGFLNLVGTDRRETRPA